MIKIVNQHIFTYVLWAVLLSVFYIITGPSNISESNDAYYFAELVRNVKLSEIGDARLVLFFLIAKTTCGILSFLFRNLDVFAILYYASALSAGVSVVLFYKYLRIVQKCSVDAAFFGAAILAFSYGFWRYATVPEVYAPSILMIIAIMLIINFVETNNDNKFNIKYLVNMAICGALSGLSVLFYQGIFFVLFIAYPLSAIQFKKIPALVIYAAFGGLIILFGYLLVFYIWAEGQFSFGGFLSFLFRRESEFPGNDMSFSMILGGIASFARMVLAFQWVFGFEFVREWIAQVFPNKNPSNELYQALHLRQIHYVALVAIVPLIVTWLVVLISAMKQRKFAIKVNLVSFLLWWALLFFGVCFVLNPFGYEPFIMILPAIAGLTAAWVAEPLAATGRTSLLALALALFVAFNWIGGLAVVGGAENDLVKRRSEWIVENATPRDVVIVVSGSWETITYIRYQVGATVLSVAQPETIDIVKSSLESGSRVFAVGDMVYPHIPLTWPKDAGNVVRNTVDAIRPLAHLIHENDAGKTFEIGQQK